MSISFYIGHGFHKRTLVYLKSQGNKWGSGHMISKRTEWHSPDPVYVIAEEMEESLFYKYGVESLAMPDKYYMGILEWLYDTNELDFSFQVVFVENLKYYLKRFVPALMKYHEYGDKNCRFYSFVSNVLY